MVSVTDGDHPFLIDSHASAVIDYNPVFSPNNSQHSSPSSASVAAPRSVSSTTADTIQTVNIRSHVPIILELNDPNYTDWRMFFDSAIGKFGLGAFLSCPTPIMASMHSSLV
jgi:FtsP/CotA-like multicopper oxidase with cupredoxin domain